MECTTKDNNVYSIKLHIKDGCSHHDITQRSACHEGTSWIFAVLHSKIFVIRDWLNVSNLTKKPRDTVHPFANQLSSHKF